MPEPSLTVNEIFHSIQGESTWTGLPCVFIRLAFCDLRCTYCDTEYAFYNGEKRSLGQIVEAARAFGCPLVEVTGGEPLLQPAAPELLLRLCDEGFTVLLETSGAHDIAPIDPRVHRIMDLKCPSSGESGRNRVENIPLLTLRDEVKFAIGSREDYEWARGMLREHGLANRTAAVLFSPIVKIRPKSGHIRGHEGLDPQRLAEWILEDRLPVRLQLQIHKIVWEPDRRGV